MNATSEPVAQKPKRLEMAARYWAQNAKSAIRDVWDALVEIITNADDRYVHLKTDLGRIEIEVERRRKGTPSIIKVRDFADGMTAETMDQKLARVGGRVSGMEKGVAVRGTNSRGAKDVAALGGVVFESIAEDGRYHKCEITSDGQYVAYLPSPKVNKLYRTRLGIATGTGTVVTLTVDSVYKVPQHKTLLKDLQSLIYLRDIIASKHRELVLIDALNVERGGDRVEPLRVHGVDVMKETFDIPGYPGVSAKLVLRRAKEPMSGDKQKFRRNGILVKSKRGIHDATFFASELENDPDAQKFFGFVRCEYIDDLCNAYDERLEKGLPETPDTRVPVLDPMRRAGLAKDHPFGKALREQVLRRLRPLIENERKERTKKRGAVENHDTRKRLDALEKEAARFMEKHRDDDEAPNDPDGRRTDSNFRRSGHSLNPQFCQIVVGSKQRFWLNVDQEAHPEVSVGDSVRIACDGDEIASDKRIAHLEAHPAQSGVLRTTWTIEGVAPTPATGITAEIGAVNLDAAIEVLAFERDKYAHVKGLMFSKKSYTVTSGGTRKIRIYAPLSAIAEHGEQVTVRTDSRAFDLSGSKSFTKKVTCAIGIVELRVKALREGAEATIVAELGSSSAIATLKSRDEQGAPLQIKLVDDDFGNQRYRWKTNILEVATKHPSLSRYLGAPPDFDGQDLQHFRVLVAEIVAEACCQRIVSRNVAANPADYEDADWDRYYAEYSKLMTEFLPTAHRLQVTEI